MSASRKETLKSRIGYERLLLWRLSIFFVCTLSCGAEKFQYASATECGRHSLDAVYNEKFKIITDNVFKDCIEFVDRVSDSISDSLTSIMAQLPDREASDNQEKKIFLQFKAAKDTFSSRVMKLHRSVGQSWESLVSSHFDLMYDSGNCSLALYVNKTNTMTDAYKESRKVLDSSLEQFVGFIKGTVRDGLQGISAAAADALKKDAGKNATGKETADKEANNESEAEKLMKKKLEIAEMIVQGFLGRLTTEVIRRDVDLFKKVDTTPEERESVLDDLEFDMLMIKNRVLAIVQPDLPPKDKGSVDLARRSIYTYWADMADGMYKEKIRSKENSKPGGDLYYRRLWSDDTVLMNTLLSLMEVYS